MLIRPLLLPNSIELNNGLAGITVLANNAVSLPDGSIIRVPFSEHQALINRAVRGVIPERLYLAYDLQAETTHFIEEEEVEVVVLGEIGERKYDVLFCYDAFYLKLHMPRLNLLTQEKDEGTFYLRFRHAAGDVAFDHDHFSPSSSGQYVGSVDVQVPRVICSGWHVYGDAPQDYYLSVSDRPAPFGTYVPSPDICQANAIFNWGTEYFKLVDGKAVKVPKYVYDQQSSAPMSSSLHCTLTTDFGTVTYSMV